MGAQANAPVIIKKKKVVSGGGHHGGAWKVAYADFVTAMMAFFLLMWLLNATTEKQRKGLADYFSPTIPTVRVSGGGDGALGGDSVFTEETMAYNGAGSQREKPSEAEAAKGDSGLSEAREKDAKASDEALKKIEEALFGTGGESMIDDNLRRHIRTRVTDEGLIIEIFATESEPLFYENSDEPTRLLRDITAILPEIFSLVTNHVAINAHTRAYPVVISDNPVWDLSQQRADKMRRMLEEAGLEAGRMERVAGYADRKPVVQNPMAVRNNRLEVILLRSDR